MSTNPSVVMLSAGIDSTALLSHLLAENVSARGIFITFGQASALRQQAMAQRLSWLWHVPLDIGHLAETRNLYPFLDPPHIMMTESTPKNLVLGEDKPCWDSMHLVETATISSANNGANNIYYGATLEDVERIPRLREMLDHVRDAVRINTSNDSVELLTPFIEKNHAEVLRILLGNKTLPKVDTWSCYWGGALHCGKCGGCKTRKKRFESAGEEDFTFYDRTQ